MTSVIRGNIFGLSCLASDKFSTACRERPEFNKSLYRPARLMRFTSIWWQL